MLDIHGRVTLVDWGLAKIEVIQNCNKHLSNGEGPTVVLGTLEYMSPEQLRDPHVRVQTAPDIRAPFCFTSDFRRTETGVREVQMANDNSEVTEPARRRTLSRLPILELRRLQADSPTVEREADLALLRAAVHRALVALSPERRLVLQLSFGIGGFDPCSSEEIARLLKVTRERVFGIIATTISRLRNPRGRGAALAKYRTFLDEY